jgi:DDE superfamily endonuclease
MKQKEVVELYTDYLMCTSGQATATGLSAMVDGEMSHDQVTRFLSEKEYSSKDLWKEAKPMVRKIEKPDGILIFDDTIEEKEWTDENAVVCWHYDHSKGRSVKGINILNALYYSSGISIPVGFEIIKKEKETKDEKTGKTKRSSKITKNQLMRAMLGKSISNQLQFQYVLMDSWFAAQENFQFIVKKQKHFIAALKDNRLIALSAKEKKAGAFQRVEKLQLADKEAVRGWLKGFDQEVLIVRQIFKNKDGSTGILNLVCSDLTLDGEQVTTIYKKRWKVEEFHKSLKSNAALAKSPTRTPITQNNHIFMAIFAVFKLECLKLKHKLNHFALRAKIFIKATQSAFKELRALQSSA